MKEKKGIEYSLFLPILSLYLWGVEIFGFWFRISVTVGAIIFL